MRIWRISNYADLSGRGGESMAGRWNNRGTPIVYCTDHPSTAMLEVLVHFDPSAMPESYKLLEIEVPHAITPVAPDLPEAWRDDLQVTRDQFDAFCAEAASPVMTVPSVIMPHAFNHLINPRHPDAGAITITRAIEHPLDPRFLT